MKIFTIPDAARLSPGSSNPSGSNREPAPALRKSRRGGGVGAPRKAKGSFSPASAARKAQSPEPASYTHVHTFPRSSTEARTTGGKGGPVGLPSGVIWVRGTAGLWGEGGASPEAKGRKKERKEEMK